MPRGLGFKNRCNKIVNFKDFKNISSICLKFGYSKAISPKCKVQIERKDLNIVEKVFTSLWK